MMQKVTVDKMMHYADYELFYRQKVDFEVEEWKRSIYKGPSLIEKASKGIQKKTARLIPEKMQNMITTTIKAMTQTIMFGSKVFTPKRQYDHLPFHEREQIVRDKYDAYRNMAIAEGIGCGAGGFLLGAADFPALLTIKMKFLFTAAHIYGYDVNDKYERLYILYVFHLAFSSREHQQGILKILEHWDTGKAEQLYASHVSSMDWKTFQMEYRDYLDMAKLLQLMPVIGAGVGGIANHGIMQNLLKSTMNCYRMRSIASRSTIEEQ